MIYKQYIAYVDAKTATLMSTCCKCSAIISGADEETVSALSKFGTNFGIAYQLMDDFLDDEQPQSFEVNLLLQTKIYCEKAKKNLDIFENNNYKKQFLNLIRYILDKPKLKQEKYQDQSS